MPAEALYEFSGIFFFALTHHLSIAFQANFDEGMEVGLCDSGSAGGERVQRSVAGK